MSFESHGGSSEKEKKGMTRRGLLRAALAGAGALALAGTASTEAVAQISDHEENEIRKAIREIVDFNLSQAEPFASTYGQLDDEQKATLQDGFVLTMRHYNMIDKNIGKALHSHQIVGEVFNFFFCHVALSEDQRSLLINTYKMTY